MKKLLPHRLDVTPPPRSGRRRIERLFASAAVCVVVAPTLSSGCKALPDRAGAAPVSSGALPAASSSSTSATRGTGASLFEPITDARLVNAIEAAFARDGALRGRPVHVAVELGVVTLDGAVPTLAAKWRAEQLVDDLKGATSVVDRLRVAAPARKDAELEAEVVDAIKSDPATRNASVETSVSLGTVTLRGSADSYAQRELLGHVAARIRGVQGVTVAVAISKVSSRSDAELAADVRDGLRDDARLDGSLSTVEVHGKDAILSGIAGSLAQRDAAVEDAWAAGVASVDVRALVLNWRENLPQLIGAERSPPTDPHMADAVRRRLLADDRLGGQVPSVSIQGGVVTLSGNVIDFRAKNAAGRDARRVSGVERVEDRMSVAPAKPESDRTIEKQLTRAVYDDASLRDAPNVQIMTSRGRVTLQGAVASAEERRTIEADAEESPGVVAIDDHLEVKGYGPATHGATAASIRHDVVEAIFWDPRVGAGRVAVDAAANGDVTLSGRVDDWTEARAADDDAVTAGAAHVIDHVRVGGTSPAAPAP